MAQPSKQRPYAIEAKYPGLDTWYGLDAYRSSDEAKAMLPVYAKRGKAKGVVVRLRDIREAEG